MLWIVAITLIVVSVAILKILRPLNYWKNRNVPHETPWPLFGNVAPYIFKQKSFPGLLQDSYNKFPNHRYYGFYQFGHPILSLRDPDLIKQIFIKEFESFTDRLEFLPKDCDPFWNKNLISMPGNEWHDMRNILSPMFTSGKLKVMFGFLKECAQKYLNYFRSLNNGETITIEMQNIFMRFANDIITSTAFGVEINSIKDNEFYRVGTNAFDFKGIKNLKFVGVSLGTCLVKLLGIKFFDENTENFFKEVVNETIEFRKHTGCVRLDMIHYLREAQKGRNIADADNETISNGFAATHEATNSSKSFKKMTITNENIAAQAAAFFFGGFDTVGTLISYMAYELALNPDVQKILVEEVDETFKKCNAEITYNTIAQMKYMDMVTSETLRKWPGAVFITRKCSKPFTIQPKNSSEKPLTLNVGDAVQVSVYSIHRDHRHYPNPAKFDPERFNAENRHNIHSGTYIPFGIGPRSCIASRFGLMEAKVIIFLILTEFESVPVQKTQIPFEISKTNVNVTTDCGFWLGLKPRQCRMGYKK